MKNAEQKYIFFLIYKWKFLSIVFFFNVIAKFLIAYLLLFLGINNASILNDHVILQRLII